jgi:hypothetical protein
MIAKTISFLMLCFLPMANGQFVKQLHLKVAATQRSGNDKTPSALSIGQPISAISFKIQTNQTFEGAYIKTLTDSFALTTDPHQENGKDGLFSNIIVFHGWTDSVSFCPGGLRGEITVFFYNSGPTPVIKQINDLKSGYLSACNAPPSVPQSEWRSGLPVPSYSRVVHHVGHLIIHHSATGNALTNFTDVVRNIYLYHTQTRGWSDIGYNYVIAQNGVIYNGRDPGPYEQDNVLGAHFCSSNTGTMGTCILGDYSQAQIQPTDTSVASLQWLLAWKAYKESLDPLTSAYHPLDPKLNIVAGHRDGCPTICPGDGIYNQLGSVRQNIQNLMAQCLQPITRFGVKNPVADNLLEIQSPLPIIRIDLFDISGRTVFQADGQGLHSLTMAIPDLSPSVYILKVQTTDTQHQKKIYVE